MESGGDKVSNRGTPGKGHIQTSSKTVLDEISWKRQEEGGRQLVFSTASLNAQTLPNKDLHLQSLSSFQEIFPETVPVTVHFLGPTERQIHAELLSLNTNSECSKGSLLRHACTH